MKKIRYPLVFFIALLWTQTQAQNCISTMELQAVIDSSKQSRRDANLRLGHFDRSYPEVIERYCGDDTTLAFYLKEYAIALKKNGLIRSAIGPYNEAIDRLEKLQSFEDNLANWYLGCGTLYSRVGEFEIALDYFEKAGKLSTQIGYGYGELIAHVEAGTAKRYLGDLVGAEASTERGLSLAEDHFDFSYVLSNLSDIKIELGKLTEADEALQKGHHHAKLAQDDEFLFYYHQAKSEIAIEQLNTEQAISEIEKAIELSDTLEISERDIVRALHTQAELYRIGNRVQDALESYFNCLERYGIDSNELAQPASLSVDYLIYESIVGIAEIKQKLGKQDCLFYYESAVKYAVQSWERLLSSQAQDLYAKEDLAWIEGACEAAVMYGEIESAVIWKEIARVRSAVFSSNQRSRSTEQLAEALNDLEQLNDRISAKAEEIEIAKGNDWPYYDNLQAMMLDYERIKDSVYSLYSISSLLSYEETEANIRQTIHEIEEDELLVQLLVHDNAIGISALAADDFKYYRFENFYEVRQIINAIYRQFENITKINSEFDPRLFKQLQEAYTKLVEPILEDFPDKRKLVFLPDDLLYRLPWAALPLSSEAKNWKDVDWLINHKSISVRHSIYQSSASPEGNTYMGFAPSYDYTEAVDQIPSATSEVKKSLEYFLGEIFLGLNATRENFLRNALRADVLHLSMHADVDSSVNGIFPYLIFEPLKEDSSLRNCRVYTGDIRKIGFSPYLSILSGCKTAIGNPRKGEGLFDFSRAFIDNGSATVVSNLWNAEDESTMSIVSYFAEVISKGYEMDQALQAAQLNYLESAKDPMRANPIYWAFPIVYGETDPLKSKRAIPTNLLLALFGGFLIVFMAYKITWPFWKSRNS